MQCIVYSSCNISGQAVFKDVLQLVAGYDAYDLQLPGDCPCSYLKKPTG